MTRNVIVASARLSLAEAWRTLEQNGIRHLPVVEDGTLLGMVSDRDLLLAGQSSGPGDVEFDGASVLGEIMSMCLVTCTPDTSVAAAAQVMIERKIDALPVVAGRRLVGLVTSTDLLALLLARPPEQTLPFHFSLYEVPCAA